MLLLLLCFFFFFASSSSFLFFFVFKVSNGLSMEQNTVLDMIKQYSDSEVGIPMDDLIGNLRGRLDEPNIK